MSWCPQKCGGGATVGTCSCTPLHGWAGVSWGASLCAPPPRALRGAPRQVGRPRSKGDSPLGSPQAPGGGPPAALAPQDCHSCSSNAPPKPGTGRSHSQRTHASRTTSASPWRPWPPSTSQHLPAPPSRNRCPWADSAQPCLPWKLPPGPHNAACQLALKGLEGGDVH